MIDKYSKKKRWIGIGISVLVTISVFIQPVFAQPWAYEEKTESILASGVSHQRILRFGEQGWQHVNVVRIDLNEQHTELNLLQSSSGVSQRDTLTNMMQQMDQPVAGINADFFYLTRPDSPMGVMVRDGQLVSSPVIDKPFSSLVVTKSESADLVDWHNHLYVSTENGSLFSVYAYNKITWNYHMITILDRNWGEMTPGAADDYRDLVEIVVENGIVKEVRRGLPAVSIPANGYVLLASGQQGQTLLQGIRQGEAIAFYPQTVPSLADIKVGVGGGTVLVRNGQTVLFSEPVSGNHPRSAVGINRSGDQLILVTVDGRHRSYTGVDGQKLAALMIELGSDKAILMDGGGSTTMAVRELGESSVSLANNPSDGSQRRVINGLAVRSTAPQGNLEGLLFQSDQESVFINHALDLQVKGYDTYYQAYAVNAGAVQYRVVEGKGRIEGQRLIPEAAGKLVVEASFGGRAVRKTVDVLSEVAALQIHVPRYTVNPGGSLALSVEGVDSQGFRAPLSLSRVQLSDDQGLGVFQNSTYQAGQRTGTTVIRASYNGHQAAVPLAVGLRREPSGKLENYQPSFLGYPAEVRGRVNMVAGGAVNPNAVQLTYDLTGSVATTAAYVVFGNQGIPVPEQANRMAVQVHAEDTAPHWIRGQLRDGSGQTHTIDFKQGIDWTGWSTLEAAIPQNITKPVYVERLYVVEPDPFYKTSGTLLFDGIEFLSPYSLPVLTVEEAGGQVKDPLRQVPNETSTQWMVHGGSNDQTTLEALLKTAQNGYETIFLTGSISEEIRNQMPDRFIGGTGGYDVRRTDQQLVISLDNRLDGLRKTNYQQWPWLLNTLKGSIPDQVIILLPRPILGPQGFSDVLEAQLLVDQLSKLTESGKQVMVFHGSDTFEVELINGVRYIGMGKNSQQAVGLYQSAGRLFYNPLTVTGTATVPAQEPSNASAQTAFRVGQRYYTTNGQQIQLDTAPYIKDGRLMVPVAHISRALGLPRENVEWDAMSETVLVRTAAGKTLLMTIGSSQLWVDDDQVEMGVAAEITNNRSFVPISRFASAMEIEYEWIPETETVIF
ncbi:MAG: phosphodiester glycosidase family protein [Bacillota bacterium]|nr:phosphodiester glycosidase family protein [Bacillota bacterium]MDW7677200.1 phosphodiester glycosidase family protein [Bacillota bacterium]